uniref:Uncharacterized protein n=1 Tax=Anguilla anguilla TaxID=7936 RepID=A0A0E9W7N8_ANGAN
MQTSCTLQRNTSTSHFILAFYSYLYLLYILLTPRFVAKNITIDRIISLSKCKKIFINDCKEAFDILTEAEFPYCSYALLRSFIKRP